ncbi:MAG: hypothetical protein V1918_09335 [Planctomycetota bacterium]
MSLARGFEWAGLFLFLGLLSAEAYTYCGDRVGAIPYYTYGGGSCGKR